MNQQDQRAAFDEQIELPPLPSGLITYEFPDGAYDGADMENYARQAIDHDRRAEGDGE